MDKKEFLSTLKDSELAEELMRRLNSGRQARRELNRMTVNNKRGRRKKLSPVSDVLNRPIREFTDLSNRAKNALLSETPYFPAIEKFNDLLRLSHRMLKSRPKIWNKVVAEIARWMEKYGYELP